ANPANNGVWSVNTINGPLESLLGTLASQVWWGDQTLAALFASTLTDQLGYPNTFSPNNGMGGPFFAFSADTGDLTFIGAAIWTPDDGLEVAGAFQIKELEDDYHYAVARREGVSVSEPAPYMTFLLGLAGLWILRRRLHN
ncbi:MAG: hypothetical protein KUG75_05150, partial [Pseudomonadales bacterium]|nr:hypothetical protein [Pseudomonadales bacterium]